MKTTLLMIIFIPIIEIYLFINIGSQIGAISTISLILFTAILGVFYARYEGFNTLRSAINQLLKNEIPFYEPGLLDLIKSNKERLSFTNKITTQGNLGFITKPTH